MNYDMKCQLLAEGYKQEQLEEGAFETKVNGIKSGINLDKEVKKFGLGYNGGDPVYTNRKRNATIVSWGCNSKMVEFLKNNGILTTPTSEGNEYFLEYNLRTKKFQLVRCYQAPGRMPKWFNPVTLSGDIEQNSVFKRLAEIAPQYKRNMQLDWGKGPKGDYTSALAYVRNKRLAESEEDYFNY